VRITCCWGGPAQHSTEIRLPTTTRPISNPPTARQSIPTKPKHTYNQTATLRTSILPTPKGTNDGRISWYLFPELTESTPNRYPCPSPDERQHSSRHIGHFWPIGLSATSTSLTRASASHPSSRGLPTYLTYYVFTVPPTGTRHTHWLGTASFLVLMDSSLPAARRSPANHHHHHHPLSRKERKDSSLPFAIGFLFFISYGLFAC
jgi:hypothetical protein